MYRVLNSILLGSATIILPLTALADAAAPADSNILVEGQALRPSPGLATYSVTEIDAATLARSGQPRLDERLKTVPGLSLFRRTSSAVAHPTSQGISMRGIGPNGAGRSLVLIDGVPANDPFGGWVYWSAINTAAIHRIDVIRGGGAGTYGNAAIAGTLRIETRLPQGHGGYADLSAGTQSTTSGVIGLWTSVGKVTLDLEGQHYDSAGYHVLDENQRGPVDLRADNELNRGRLGLTWRNDDGLVVRATLARFTEDRNNGTSLTYNNTSSTEATLRMVQDRGDSGFEATLYWIDRSFESQFSSINATRDQETPSLLQYDVPVKTVGGNLLWRQAVGTGTLELGADARWIEGETREFFTYQTGAFRRDRVAGGEQLLAGIFAEYTASLGSHTRFTTGLRLDHLRNSDGQRREINLDTDEVLRDDHFARNDRTVVNGRFGLTHDFENGLSARAVVYSGFRTPSINELYRPFRVRNDITEANAALKPERLFGGDLGLAYENASGLSLSLTGFLTWLKDGVANVLIATAPGNYPEFGVFLPAGGTLNQRRNLDRVRTYGLEAEAVLPLSDRAGITARYLLTEAEVTRAKDDPSLVGFRPPQVPRHQATLALNLTLPDVAEGLTLAPLLRAESAQYDDPLNTRRLPGYVTADLFLSLGVTGNISLYASGENLFDKTIISGLSGDGLRSLAAPRQVRFGLRAAF